MFAMVHISLEDGGRITTYLPKKKEETKLQFQSARAETKPCMVVIMNVFKHLDIHLRDNIDCGGLLPSHHPDSDQQVTH